MPCRERGVGGLVWCVRISKCPISLKTPVMRLSLHSHIPIKCFLVMLENRQGTGERLILNLAVKYF